MLLLEAKYGVIKLFISYYLLILMEQSSYNYVDVFSLFSF
jgi:hypothetical protein